MISTMVNAVSCVQCIPSERFDPAALVVKVSLPTGDILHDFKDVNHGLTVEQI